MLPAYLSGGTFYWRVAAADDLVANVGDYTAPRTFTVTAAPVSRTSTSITLGVVKTAKKVKVSGSVSPYVTGQVTVRLFRKRSGAFRLVTTKHPTLGSFSTYNTSFARPRSGTCKAVARYDGDSRHLPSQRAVKFGC
jgi:hypothetical protein